MGNEYTDQRSKRKRDDIANDDPAISMTQQCSLKYIVGLGWGFINPYGYRYLIRKANTPGKLPDQLKVHAARARFIEYDNIDPSLWIFWQGVGDLYQLYTHELLVSTIVDELPANLSGEEVPPPKRKRFLTPEEANQVISNTSTHSTAAQHTNASSLHLTSTLHLAKEAMSHLRQTQRSTRKRPKHDEVESEGSPPPARKRRKTNDQRDVKPVKRVKPRKHFKGFKALSEPLPSNWRTISDEELIHWYPNHLCDFVLRRLIDNKWKDSAISHAMHPHARKQLASNEANYLRRWILVEESLANDAALVDPLLTVGTYEHDPAKCYPEPAEDEEPPRPIMPGSMIASQQHQQQLQDEEHTSMSSPSSSQSTVTLVDLTESPVLIPQQGVDMQTIELMDENISQPISMETESRCLSSQPPPVSRTVNNLFTDDMSQDGILNEPDSVTKNPLSQTSSPTNLAPMNTLLQPLSPQVEGSLLKNGVSQNRTLSAQGQTATGQLSQSCQVHNGLRNIDPASRSISPVMIEQFPGELEYADQPLNQLPELEDSAAPQDIFQDSIPNQTESWSDANGQSDTDGQFETNLNPNSSDDFTLKDVSIDDMLNDPCFAESCYGLAGFDSGV